MGRIFSSRPFVLLLCYKRLNDALVDRFGSGRLNLGRLMPMFVSTFILNFSTYGTSIKVRTGLVQLRVRLVYTDTLPGTDPSKLLC